jgi:hypothetical protein
MKETALPPVEKEENVPKSASPDESLIGPEPLPKDSEK